MFFLILTLIFTFAFSQSIILSKDIFGNIIIEDENRNTKKNLKVLLKMSDIGVKDRFDFVLRFNKELMGE